MEELSASEWLKKRHFILIILHGFLLHSKLNIKDSTSLHFLTDFEKGLLQAVGRGIG